MGAAWTQVSGPGGGAALAGDSDSVLCVSGWGTIWSSVTSRATQKVREMMKTAKTRWLAAVWVHVPVAAVWCSSSLRCNEPTASAGPTGPSSAASGFPGWRPSPGEPRHWAGSLGKTNHRLADYKYFNFHTQNTDVFMLHKRENSPAAFWLNQP